MPDNIPRHPDYDLFLPDWRLMRDCQMGERKIKDEGELYLPMPSGMRAIQRPEIRNAAYHAYKQRANFPDLVSQTVRGLSGVIHKKPATIALPAALEPLKEKATRDGLTLDALHRRITRELMLTGRAGLLADVTSSGQPYLATYLAEHVVNWDTDEEENLTLVLLDESGYKRGSGFNWDYQKQYRALLLEDGAYRVAILDESGEEIEESIEPRSRNGRLNEIPFTFIDTNDLTPTPDEVPLLGLGQLAVRIYGLDADYRQSLYMTSGPMMVLTGAEQEEAPDVVGSGALVVLSNPNARMEMLEYRGHGTNPQRQAIIDGFDQATTLGARMIHREGRQAESGEALRLRFGNEATVIDSIAKTSSAGLEDALRNLARWVGVNPDEVQVVPPEEFVDQKLGPQELTAITNAWSTIGLPRRDIHWNLQQGGRIRPDISYEEWESEIQTESPFGPPMEEETEDEPEEVLENE